MGASVHCAYGSLLTLDPSQSVARTGTDNGGNDVILLQNVYGELAIFMPLVRNCVIGVILSLQITQPSSCSLEVV